jgi:uncharacterized phage protein (TIGR02218 family)
LCWCWKLTRKDGVVFGSTEHDEDLTFGGVTYEAATGFTPSSFETQAQLAVDTIDLFGALISNRLSEDALAAGLFDNASIEMWRVNWKNTRQRYLKIAGSIGEVSRGRTAFKAEFRSAAHALNQDVGRAFSKVCDADLGDSRCTVDLDNSQYRGSGYVSAVIGDGLFEVSGLDDFDDGWFSDGLFTFTSGANVTVAKEVRHHTKLAAGGIMIELLEPQPFIVAVGDAFFITAGCDKTAQTCQDKFDNLVNFRGFPFIPGNDVILRAGDVDDNNDGNSLF